MLSAVLLNCALLVIFRFATIANLVLGPSFAETLFLVLGALSVAAAAFFMYVQRDIKRLLAYSSMENIGLIVLAFGIGGPAGIFAGLLQAVNHSLVKSLMFCTTGNILIKYGSRDLERVQGMLQVIPASGVLMLVGALALVGAPPFNIFLSKFLIVTTGLGGGYLWLMVLCLVFLTIIFAAFFRVIGTAVFGEGPADLHKGEANWLTLAPEVVLIVLIIALGLYIPPALMALLNHASGIALTGSPHSTLAWQSGRDLLASIPQLLR
jgi:hydrogenase-4 component F